MKAIRVSDRLSIGDQITLSDISKSLVSGFASVINNRPDGEEPSQLTAHEASLEAEFVGLAYSYQPETLNVISKDDVRKFQQHVAELEGPVLAHCRSGTRSLGFGRSA